ASALIFGLLLGVATTVFGYSNTAPVNVGWSIFHLDGIPLWTVPVVPLVIVLVAGTLYHWFNSLHHFTEHMRHRHRVHELEAEVSRLRAHLDQVLEMPRGEALKAKSDKPSLPQADLAAADAEMAAIEPVDAKPAKASKGKRAKLLPEPSVEAAMTPTTNGDHDGVTAEPQQLAAA